MPGPAPPQVISHLESPPSSGQRAGPCRTQGPERQKWRFWGQGDAASSEGDAGARELCSELNSEKGATRLGSTAKPRGRGCTAGRVQLSLHRDLEGCESFSNNKRNSHPITRRTLGQKATQRAPDLKHISQAPIAVLTMLARNSDCLENEVESQRKEGLASM